MIDLTVLKGMIVGTALTADDVWVATPNCERDLENYNWDYREVLTMITCLAPSDYKSSVWCQVKGGGWYPCDAYRFNYDSERHMRNARGLEVYVKFSLTEQGRLTLVLVSCHGSR